MALIKRQIHEEIIVKEPDCYQPCKTVDFIENDINCIITEYKEILLQSNIKHTSTWLLEKDLLILYEKKLCPPENETLSRGRIVLVNPGVSNIGREQRYLHHYIVLGEFKETFIGVPITNMAYDKSRKIYYLRNFFEVELKDPDYKKPFSEYRCSKPSIADVRNISGLDKRRIVQNQLYKDKKFVPNTYLNAISEKIRETISKIV